MKSLIFILLILILSLTNCCPVTRMGPPGPKGATGDVGALGPQGVPGSPGKDGSSCTTTTVPINNVAPNGGALISCGDGSSSLVLNGATGAQGAQGMQGIQGVAGQNGTNGTNGVDGINGTNGSNGVNGTNGTNGQDGTPGTIISPIQFCDGQTTYPSSFPEVGFCINHKIYAVYSANGGFLTEVAPGNWSSNGIGVSCNFTVSDDCVISR